MKTQKHQETILKEISSKLLLESNSRNLYFTKGEDPLSAVDCLEYFHFIVKGKIKIYDIDFYSSKEQTIYMLYDCSMFDVVSLLNGKPSQYISEVLEDTYVIQLPMEDVKEMILNDEVFREYFYSYVATQLASVEDLVVSFSFYDVYHRILHLFNNFTQTSEGECRLNIINNLSHEDLASMVGSVRKVVNRSLQKLKKENIIEISRKNIQITDFKKLLDRSIS